MNFVSKASNITLFRIPSRTFYDRKWFSFHIQASERCNSVLLTTFNNNFIAKDLKNHLTPATPLNFEWMSSLPDRFRASFTSPIQMAVHNYQAAPMNKLLECWKTKWITDQWCSGRTWECMPSLIPSRTYSSTTIQTRCFSTGSRACRVWTDVTPRIT